MNYTQETITPEKAKSYLLTSTGNRPISPVFVKSYADTMKKGGWLLNGMCIIFDNQGHLIDGHHRLQAVIEAGIPVTFDVCRGVSNDSFTTYDCGRHRTIGQILAMQGVKHYNMVGSIVAANSNLLSFGRLHGNISAGSHKGRGSATNAEKYDEYSKDPDGFNAVAVVIVRLQGRCRLLPASWAGGIYYYLTHTGGFSESYVLEFFEDLYRLDASEHKCIDLLRKLIIQTSFSGKKLSAEFLWAYIAKTWNYYVSEKEPAFLRYVPDKESIPHLLTAIELQ